MPPIASIAPAAPAAPSVTRGPEAGAAQYGWATTQAPHSCAYLVPPVLAILRSLNARRVLDIGAGNGTLCVALRAAGIDAVGVENDAQGVQLARASHPGTHFHHFGVQDDPGALMAHEAPFDAVVSTEVIEHLFSPHLLPLYAAGTLPRGGHLVVSTPFHGYLKNLALSLANKWDHHHTVLWHGGHIKFWSRKTLTQLLGDNGFDVVAFHGIGRAPYLWKSMVLVARKR